MGTKEKIATTKWRNGLPGRPMDCFFNFTTKNASVLFRFSSVVFLVICMSLSMTEYEGNCRFPVVHAAARSEYEQNEQVKNQQQQKQNFQGHSALWEQAVGSIELPRHSWEAPLTFDNYLGDWDLAMATIPAHHYVVLTPAVANRTGMMWHRSPLKTKNFEIQFGFGVFGDDRSYINFANGGPASARPEGFAFWYVYDEYAKIFPKSSEEQAKWNLFGYKNNPRGLGIFFKNFDKNGQLRPSISAIYSGDGNRVIDTTRDLPSPDGIYYQNRNEKNPVTFRLLAGPGGVVGDVRITPADKWIRCFHLNVSVESGGYIGFTSFNGPEEFPSPPTNPHGLTEKATASDLVSLYFLKVWNLDLSVTGEDNTEVSKELGDIAVEDILRSHSDHRDERDLSDSLKQLTRMLYKHISEQTPREQTIQRMLTSLTTQISKLSMDLRELKSEMRNVSSKTNTESMQSVHTELSGLKNLFQRHSQRHSSHLSTLQQRLEAKTAETSNRDSPHLKELVDRTQQIENAISTQGSSTLLTVTVVSVLIVLVAFVIFVWKRFRELEKKHYL